MARSAISYASPRIAKDLAKAFGKSASPLVFKMRESKDVPRFIRKVEAAHQKAAKSRLHFG